KVYEHAEILALKAASDKFGDWRLEGCKLVVTLEPCPMCLSAVAQSRIDLLIFGAYDLKGGAISLGYNVLKDPRLNHRARIVGGIDHFDNSKLLSNFFKQKRKSYKVSKR